MSKKLRVVCSVPDYPQWYVKKDTWEKTGKFSKKMDGRLILSIPYNPFGATMECWFEGRMFKGAIYTRFMSSYITWKPLLL
jgi:hypothetical protein